MISINIEGHELKFEKDYVDKFEKTICDSFEDSARIYLLTDFEEKSIDEIFFQHTKEEIIETIMEASKQEIDLYCGEL